MKYHFGTKIVAFLLAAVLLLTVLGSALSILFLESYNLYSQTPAQWEKDRLQNRALDMAHQVLQRYTAQKLGKLTRDQLTYTGRNYTNQDLSQWYSFDYDSWDYWITDLEGKLMDNGVRLTDEENLTYYSFNLNCDYPVHATAEESAKIEQTQNWNYRDYYCTETEEHFLYFYSSPNYLVHMRFRADAHRIYTGISGNLLDFLYGSRYHLIILLVVSLLLFIGCTVYLCFAAGRTPTDPVPKVRGLNRLPLDLYLGVCGFATVLLTAGAFVLVEDTTYVYEDILSPLAVCLSGLMLFAASLLAVAMLYTTATQLKQKNGYWWRRSVIGWCLRKIWQFFRFCFRGIRKIYRMLPLIWQWLVTAAAMVITPLLCLLLADATYGFFRFMFALWLVSAVLADIAMVLYGAYAFGILIRGAKKMAQGNLNEKIPTKHLFGAFKDFALSLNDLADAAMIAAQKQTQSERMKTELITNVSHDIKTPLTSIINYVDLLQSPHTEEQGRQYLEVLARQSKRMKKLVEDLMDMSKASSGNIQVEITALDAVEAINQALGEFTDKLTAARLTPVFRAPEEPVTVLADGRHTWRVLSNLLSNTVKYAMPGTRLYIDLVRLPGCVQISLKNISAEPLNVSAEELTERFVRGDASRNTEGSGLGLNIAKSLMELQRGNLELLVDGDLFKVILTFPAE